MTDTFDDTCDLSADYEAYLQELVTELSQLCDHLNIPFLLVFQVMKDGFRCSSGIPDNASQALYRAAQIFFPDKFYTIDESADENGPIN